MPYWTELLQLLTLAFLGLGAYLLFLLKTGAEATVKTSAEEGVKAAFRQFEWTAELARELQKSRGVERQELRFKSYGALWKELRPLAIYDATTIDRKTAGDLYAKLTNWYFSECGGLLLTPQARDFYFSLQDLLRVTSSIADWRADRSKEFEGDADKMFRRLLGSTDAKETKEAITVFDYFSAGDFGNWQEHAIDLGKKWREAVKHLGAAWEGLNDLERFAVLQQVGSKLRTSLVNDLESRLR